MPSSTFEEVDIAANTKSANQLSGDINEFVPFRARIDIYVVASAVDQNITMLADSDVVIDDHEIHFIGTTITKSDHLMDSFVVEAGTRLALFIRNTGAATTTDIIGQVDVTPV